MDRNAIGLVLSEDLVRNLRPSCQTSKTRTLNETHQTERDRERDGGRCCRHDEQQNGGKSRARGAESISRSGVSISRRRNCRINDLEAARKKQWVILAIA